MLITPINIYIFTMRTNLRLIKKFLKLKIQLKLKKI